MDFFDQEYAWLLDLGKDAILSKGEATLGSEPFQITDIVAPMSAGSPHDYYSNGDYWWPNPNIPNGLPYLNRDGESNPDNFDHHRLLLRRLRTNVANLAAAYKISGAEKYAAKAVQLLKGFFLDEKTKMNPHLLFAQAIPGICNGRSIGIIDTLHLIEVPVAIEILKSSTSLTPEVYSGLKQWFKDYLNWISTHQYGISEMKAKNNHSVCWFVQVAVFSAFVGNQKIISLCRQQYKEVILPNQMALDGSFPLELARTKPYSYSIFVLDNLITLCFSLSIPDDNLWDFRLEDGRGIRKGLEFLYPYLQDKTKWPFPKDVQHFEAWPTRMSFLLFAGIMLGEKKYLILWERLDSDSCNMEVRRNIAIRQPLLWLETLKNR